MSIHDAVIRVGIPPGSSAHQSIKKRYSELLSRYLAEEVADGLRGAGFPTTKPLRGEPGEKFENVTMLLFHPVSESAPTPEIRLVDARSGQMLTERAYFSMLVRMYNERNPHAGVGIEAFDIEDEP